MSMFDGLGQLVGMIAIAGLVFAGGLAVISVLAWIVYRMDGGRLGFLQYLRRL